MAKYFTQWEADTIGSTIAGWTARGPAAPTFVPAYGNLAVVPVKRRYGLFKPASGGDGPYVTVDAIDSDANRDKFNCLTLVVLPLSGAALGACIYTRAQGGLGAATDFYRAKALYSAGTLTALIDKRVASVQTNGIVSVALGAWSSGTSFWLRFVGVGSALSITVWAVGTTEPTTPTGSVTDAGLSAAGFIGLGGINFSSSVSHAFNFFSVGTNGDAPEIPITEAEFDAWCDDQSKTREIIAEFSALGYDPTGGGSPAYTKTVNAYISRGGFTSQAHDNPPNQHYKAIITGVPSFSVEMPSALGGEAKVNFGDLVIDNARPSSQPLESTTVGLTFDGIAQKVELSATTNVPTTFTIECWVKLVYPLGTTGGYILFSNAGDDVVPINGYRFGIDTNVGRPYIEKFVATVGSGSFTVDRAFTFDGKPHHVAVVCNGSTALFFIDGVQVPTASYVTTFTTASLTNKGRIGTDIPTFNDTVKGSMDEVRLWNTARTAAQILAYKNVRATGSETGLIGCWHFDEGVGTTTADASPTGNNGTLTSATMWSMTGMPKSVFALPNYALNFAGTNKYVTCGNLSSMVATNGPATIEGLFTFSQFATARGASQTLHTQLYQHSANNYFYLGGGGADYFSIGASLSLNVQYHIALTYNGTHETAILYVDGVAYPVTIQSAGTSHAALNPMTIADVLGLGAKVDELRVWNVVRTPAQVADYRRNRALGTETGLVMCLHFDEGTGTTAYDATVNAYNGTLTNTPAWVAAEIQPIPNPYNWGGERDDWLRMKFNKNYLRIWIGDKSWPKLKFRPYIVGVIGQPTAPSEGLINFKIADLSAFFQKDLQTSLFTSGAYSGQRKPIFMGQIGRGSHVGGQIEPPLTDVANLIYTISDAAIGAWYTSLTDYMRVFDRQTELKTAALTNSAVAGNTLTTSAAHGMTVNYLWRSPASGALPTPLALNTDYWVQSAPTTTTFTLSATRGGAVITLTSATLVAVASYGYGYTVTTTAPASIQLASGDPTQMRITVSDILTSAAGSYATGFTPKQVYADIIARTGLSANFIDTGTVYSLSNDCGLWWDTQKHSALDALNTFSNGSLSFYGFSVDGLFFNREIVVPAGTPVQYFGGYNIVSLSMVMVGTRKAVDFSKAEVSYAPWFLTGGVVPVGSQAALQGRSITAPTVYGATSPPLDAHPDAGEAEQLFSVTHFFTSATPVTVYSAFYAKPVDEFEFKTTLRAFRRRIGDVISVTYPRYGFKQWGVTDPASPDNTATIDGTLCTIDKITCSITFDAQGKSNADPVSLRIYKQKIGYYSTVNLTP